MTVETVSAKPYCDMTLAELEAELKQLHAVMRRAPAWSAHQAAIQSFRDDCKRWLDRRRAEERKPMTEVITVEEFRRRLKAQGVKGRDHFAMKCPMCATVQSAASFICAGAGKDFDEVERFIGFSCVGRFTNAGAPRKEPDGQPCNWTLGGLLRLHKLEVHTPDGEIHLRFEVATPEEARALEAFHCADAPLSEARYG